MNQVNLVGNLTHDIELKESPNQVKYASFCLAINHWNTNKDKKADFINLVAFGTQAEVLAQYTKKGSKLAVTGRLTADQYTDKDGNKRSSVKVIVENMEFLSSGQVAATQDANKSK